MRTDGLTAPVDPGPSPDSAAFVREFTRCQRRLYTFIVSLVRSPSDADDVLQDTNLVLWQKSQEYRPGTNFDAWAFAIARFQVMAFRKRKARAHEVFDDELLATLADEAEARADLSDRRRLALVQCLSKLRPEQAALVGERYQPGGCVSAIAQRAGKSPKAVSEQLARIRAALLRCIHQTLSVEDRP